jgi:hypothetical protein
MVGIADDPAAGMTHRLREVDRASRVTVALCLDIGLLA